ncbi:SDR family oxidoreductase [Actinocorallia glomerata]|uniref:SDR family oxidoreductase n=3 Tax=Actinomycetes TaxID=1760 RepID=A0ABP6M1T6_9MICC
MLVTGVSRRDGIGHAVACRLAAYGAEVFCHHHRPHDADQPYGADDLGAVLASVASHAIPGARVEDLGADLTVTGAPDRVVDAAVETFGGLDGLVCNQALNGSDGGLGELTEQLLDRHWAVDARASILLAQRFLHHHRDGRDASIVFMTSGQGQGPLTGEIAYGAAKAALAGITTTIAAQVSPTGIRVNTVNPGPVDTGYMTPQLWGQVASMFPRGRFGEPDDPARLIAWLMTPEAEWITGQVLHTEGGFARWRTAED